jgi:hypothetical protein
MAPNIFNDFKAYIFQWHKKLSEEMEKFWGKVSVKDTINDAFLDYFQIIKTNMDALKNGFFTAEQVNENLKNLKEMFENNLDGLNSQLGSVKGNKEKQSQ